VAHRLEGIVYDAKGRYGTGYGPSRLDAHFDVG
jgi:hypothetical protein